MPPEMSDAARALREIAQASLRLPPEQQVEDFLERILRQSTDKLADHIQKRLSRRIEDGRIINRSKANV